MRNVITVLISYLLISTEGSSFFEGNGILSNRPQGIKCILILYSFSFSILYSSCNLVVEQPKKAFLYYFKWFLDSFISQNVCTQHTTQPIPYMLLSFSFFPHSLLQSYLAYELHDADLPCITPAKWQTFPSYVFLSNEYLVIVLKLKKIEVKIIKITLKSRINFRLLAK